MIELARLRTLLPRMVEPTAVVLGWGTCLAGVTLWAMFQGLLLPNIFGGPRPEVFATQDLRMAVYYVGIIGVSVVSGVIAGDYGKSLGCFFLSYILAVGITFLVWTLPAITGSYGPDTPTLINASTDLIFRAFFPFALFLGFVGSILGPALAEHYAA